MKNSFIVLLSLVFGLLHAQDFTIEQILSAPYCSDLVGSDSGNAIAWVSSESGIRKVFTAEGPDWEPALRFSSDFDDGQIISGVQFDHSGNNLFFVLGSAPNRAGEIANPASLVQYPKRSLYRLNLSSGVLDDLGAYASFVVSPDDQFLLLLLGNSLTQLSLESKTTKPLIRMRGTFSSVSFSPDGSSIVFVSNRGDHSFIGTFDFGESRIKWISPAVDKDQSPVWSPDGVRIAFLRLPGGRNGELANITAGSNFSIVVHNLTTDKNHKIWSSPSDDGGFAQYYHSDPLRWTKSDHILFYSEHEGWMKVYSIQPDGANLRNLLSGDCEIEHSSLNNSGNRLVFSSNCGDIDRRHLFVYDLERGTSEQVTTGELIETDPILLGDDQLVFRKSGYDLMTSISTESQTIYPKSLNNDFPQDDLVQPQQAIFHSEDGTRVHGQLFVSGQESGKPAVIFMHGGPIRQMLLGFHYSSYYAFAYAMNQYLASKGYVVLSVNFRAGIGYGKEFRRAPRQGPRGASEYQDIVAGAKYLQSLPFVDPQKIGLWGGSYGGLLTAQGLARNSELFKAGVDFHGVHDWAWRAKDFSPGGFWGITEELMDDAFQFSPVADVETWSSPVLFIHGDDDRNVMFGQTVDLVQRLREKEVYHEILVLPDEVHGFYRWESWVRSYKATVGFFDRFLK